MKTVDIQAELRAHIARKYKNQKGAAQAWGVSAAFVSAVISGKKPPTATMLADSGFSKIQPEAPAPVYVRVKS